MLLAAVVAFELVDCKFSSAVGHINNDHLTAFRFRFASQSDNRAGQTECNSYRSQFKLDELNLTINTVSYKIQTSLRMQETNAPDENQVQSDDEEENTPNEALNKINEESLVDDGATEQHFYAVVNDVAVLQKELPPPPEPPIKCDGTGPRLMIKEIWIENFKSYAGRHVIGPFHKSFTAIVGPNGSGKSNVIDSLLFVFGYRAQRIRSKKISVLIHNTTEHGHMRFCKVEVHFCLIVDRPDGGYDVVAGSEFVISRTAHRDGTSVYQIDNSVVRFAQIGERLQQYGIDLNHSRFLILQGEVELISLMKAKGDDNDPGMLEYLEDLIGSSRLKPCIQELQEKINEVQDVQCERASKLKRIQTQQMNLEESKTEAIFYLRLQNEQIRIKHLKTQLKLIKHEQELKLLIEKQEQLQAEHDEIKDAVEHHKQLALTSQRELDSLKKKKNTAVAAAENVRNQYSQFEKNAEKAKKDLSTLRLEELKIKRDACLQVINDLDARLPELKATQLELQENIKVKMESVQKDTAEMTTEINTLTSELQKLKPQENAITAKLRTAQNELLTLKSQHSAGKESIDEKNKAYDELLQSIKQEELKFELCEKQLNSFERDVMAKKAELKTLIAKEASLMAELRDMENKDQEMRMRFNQGTGQNRIVQALMSEKKIGKFKGFYGRLGDLGGIDQKYDVAISTACPQLDSFVTDTMTTATECVDFLKMSNLGRATFIALDKIKDCADAIKRPFTAPKGSKRLFDLIAAEDVDVLPAFYFALRDTLVTETAEEARIIGLKQGVRRRVVSLGGMLVEMSGSMTAGGKPISGRMGRTATAQKEVITSKDLKVIQGKLDKMRDSHEAVLAEKNNMERTVESLDGKFTQAKLEYEQQRNALQMLREREVILKRELKQAKQIFDRSISAENRMLNLESEIEQLEKDLKVELNKQSSLNTELNKLQEEVASVAERAVGSLRTRLTDCEREIKAYQNKLKKGDVEARTAEKNISSTEKALERTVVEISQGKDNIGKLERQLEEFEVQAAEFKDKITEAEENMKSISKIMEDAKNEADTLGNKVQELSSHLIDVKAALKEATAKTTKRSHTVSRLKDDIGKLNLSDFCGLFSYENEDHLKSNNNNERHGFSENRYFPSDCFDQLVVPGEDEIDAVDEEELESRLLMVGGIMKNIKPDLEALEEYKEKAEAYKVVYQQVTQADELHKQLYAKLDDAKRLRLHEFMSALNVIREKLKDIYRTLTNGGDADLELIDTMNPFIDGVNYSVRPPKKTWKEMSHLSGGEKTLSSLSLVFALHAYRPTPLYVMDEIDAALDFRNVSIVGNYVSNRTSNAQFIVISLRPQMFELAKLLVGIYKTDNCTKSIPMEPAIIFNLSEDAEKKLPENNSTQVDNVPLIS
ncbi:Structural maintenance of chromosomes protein 4 [Trichinella pseudospiralis]|uniref:Structural maintenance of chromosomes protein n=1 Tax=Trichinella pseudospiralis TaxID=6337 RepID=A0A0V1JB42_TRIPS|nr:Structural maintenance of chromosomes protein 4 [Trichinella pseudospiralis]KRZ32194.1 Structural maintenance of chromosomes protein 4 [Trichinella pseudospiralis]KRZ38927.1 Structural maintenance of chromosomes protein 4 [Trichinella pseudospiralis]